MMPVRGNRPAPPGIRISLIRRPGAASAFPLVPASVPGKTCDQRLS